MYIYSPVVWYIIHTEGGQCSEGHTADFIFTSIERSGIH